MNNKHYTPLFIIALFFSCEQNTTKSNSAKKAIDTIVTADTNKIKHAATVDIDTTGLSQAPIKILKAAMTVQMADTVDNPEDNLHHEGHFARLINLKVTFKNVSSKRIIGAELNWLMVNKDGKPAPIDSSGAGIGEGDMGTCAAQQLEPYSLGIGKTETEEWQQSSRTATKIKLAYPVKVQFYDDAIWKIGKK